MDPYRLSRPATTVSRSGSRGVHPAHPEPASAVMHAAESLYVATFYKFVPIPDYRELRTGLLDCCRSHNLRGTILLAEEGINGTLSGTAGDLDGVLGRLREDSRLSDLEIRRSPVDTQPFQRMKVRIRREIVTLGVAGIDPVSMAGVRVPPTRWNALISRSDVVVIDSRNDYEVMIGTFEGAVDPGTASFGDLPGWIETRSDLAKRPPVAMFCTGGIRCEKSTAYLKQLGFDEVYHLEGGILNYLQTIPEPESLWRGECFVFDDRVSVTHGLRKGHYRLDPATGHPVPVDTAQSVE
jgi:UPF0176 protein